MVKTQWSGLVSLWIEYIPLSNNYVLAVYMLFTVWFCALGSKLYLSGLFLAVLRDIVEERVVAGWLRRVHCASRLSLANLLIRAYWWSVNSRTRLGLITYNVSVDATNIWARQSCLMRDAQYINSLVLYFSRRWCGILVCTNQLCLLELSCRVGLRARPPRLGFLGLAWCWNIVPRTVYGSHLQRG